MQMARDLYYQETLLKYRTHTRTHQAHLEFHMTELSLRKCSTPVEYSDPVKISVRPRVAAGKVQPLAGQALVHDEASDAKATRWLTF